MLINLGRHLEALNFCLSSVDVSRQACSGHPQYNPSAALRGLFPPRPIHAHLELTKNIDLTHYPKTDLTHTRPPPITFQARPSSFLLYTLTLAAFNVYGVSKFTACCLHRAYQSNPHVYGMLAHGDSDGLPDGVNYFYRNAIKYLQFQRLWKGPEIHEWLNVSKGEINKRTCDEGRCGKLEGTVGEWKKCDKCWL